MLKGKGILSEIQKRVLGSFQKGTDASYFYLTGGTALAEYYLGHRKSYDLDLFTAEAGLVVPFSGIVADGFKRDGLDVTVVRRFSSFVEFEVAYENEDTKIQLAYDSPFRFEEPVDSELGIKINDYRDIIVDKFLAFFGRAEPRDAVDLFFILRKESIEDLAELAAKKDPGFDRYWLAVALRKVKDFPDEITRWPVEMLAGVNVRELKAQFSRIALEVLENLKLK
jgi:hypothetical protein